MRKKKTVWERIKRIQKKREKIAKEYARKCNITLLAEFEDPIFADKFCKVLMNRIGQEVSSKQDKKLTKRNWEI